MFDNSNNYPYNRPSTIPRKRRWFHSKNKSTNPVNYNDISNNMTPNSNLTPSSNNQQPGLGPTQGPSKRQREHLDNNAQVARMEQQLHEYFQKTNTPYTYIDDTGIYNYTLQNNNSKQCNANANASSVNQPPGHTQPTTPMFSLFPVNPFPTNIPLSFNYTSLKWPETSIVHPPPAQPVTQAQAQEPPEEPIIEEITIQEDIDHINDLIALCDKYPLSDTKKYNINMKAIHSIKEPLVDLSKMIGMESLKRSIVDQILYYVQELHIRPSNQSTPPASALVSGAASAPVQAPTPAPEPVSGPAPLNPFANPFFPPNTSGASASASASANDISSRMDFNAKMNNPFGAIFDFSALNNKIAETIKKKYAKDELTTDFSQPTSGDFMHTVIYGPPGSGKTEVAKIIGRIFSGLGILSKKTFKKVSRNDLVAGYLGQTAIKTKDIIKASLGGVLFIDEAYSLGNSEKRDSFAKECIDTLCEALSEHKNDWMVIIAGYEKELNECFFNFNEGLNSRFTWRFKLEGYKAREMKEILEKKVTEYNWTIAEGENIQEAWFANRMEYFTTYGRDMETLFTKTKIAHSRRVFCLPKSVKTKITVKDLENGFGLFLENPEVKDRKERGGAGNYMKSLYV